MGSTGLTLWSRHEWWSLKTSVCQPFLSISYPPGWFSDYFPQVWKHSGLNQSCMRPLHQFSSVQLLSRVWLFVTPWIAAHQASLSITNSRSSLKLTSTESVMPSSHLILCHPLLLLPPIPPSIRVFSSESALRMRWPKYWSFSFSVIPSKEHPGLISFRMDWMDLLAVQGTLKSLLQQHTSNASILWHSAFFRVQLSHPYMTTGKTIALTRLKLNIQKTKIMASGPITSWEIDGETVETVSDYIFGLQNHCRWWLQPST